MKVIAGPCMAENPEMMLEVAEKLKEGIKGLDIDLYFKASFDKANRTTADSPRGPGIDKGLNYLEYVKRQTGLKLVTDVHETSQCQEVAEVVDVLQIPAMLCRQTDLVVAAADTGRIVNIKKGQFLSPYAMGAIADKALAADEVWLCERGTMFGYSDLVVDMRSLDIMEHLGYPVIFDATHSVQQPPHGSRMKSGAENKYVETLAMAAMATHCISGVFLEVHPEPSKALSDGPCMLTPDRAIRLIRELYHLKAYLNGELY